MNFQNDLWVLQFFTYQLIILRSCSGAAGVRDSHQWRTLQMFLKQSEASCWNVFPPHEEARPAAPLVAPNGSRDPAHVTKGNPSWWFGSWSSSTMVTSTGSSQPSPGHWSVARQRKGGKCQPHQTPGVSHFGWDEQPENTQCCMETEVTQKLLIEAWLKHASIMHTSTPFPILEFTCCRLKRRWWGNHQKEQGQLQPSN